MEKITYHLGLQPNKRNTPFPIYVNVRCHAMGVYCRFATNLKILSGLWDSSKKRGIMSYYVNCDEMYLLNWRLANICNEVEKHIANIYKNEKFFKNPSTLKKEIHTLHIVIKQVSKKTPTFAEEERIETQLTQITMAKKTVTPKIDIVKELRDYVTENKMHWDNRVSVGYLERFLESYGNKQYKDLSLMATTKGFTAFSEHLKKVGDKKGNDFSMTTYNKYRACLKKLFERVFVQKLGIITQTTLNDIVVVKEENKTDQKGNEIALTMEELWKIYEYQPENIYEEKAKDNLLFLCCAGVRKSDKENMENKELEVFAQKKTARRQTQTFVFSWADEIIDKWSSRKDSPTLSENALYKYIKIVSKNAGITGKHLIITQNAKKEIKQEYKERWECIGTHTGRRTFATNCWLMGMPKSKIKEFTGHTEKMVDHYVKAQEKDKDKFEEKVLNKEITLIPYVAKYFGTGVQGGVANYIAQQQPTETTQQPSTTVQQASNGIINDNVEALKVLSFLDINTDDLTDEQLNDINFVTRLIVRKELEMQEKYGVDFYQYQHFYHNLKMIYAQQMTMGERKKKLQEYLNECANKKNIK